MTVTINGTTGISSDGGYAGDGVSFADGTPSNTLVTTTGGNVGIGTSSPAAKFAVSNGGAAGFEFSPTGGISSGTYIQSYNRSTSAYVANTNYAATHTWYVAGTRAMDIDSSGNLLVGTTSAGVDKVRISASHGPNANLGLVCADDINGTYVSFRNSAATQIGSITRSGASTVSYNTSSDYRLKENIVPMTGALAKVAQLKPVTYNWKVDGSPGEGFIAHELQEVVPDCVTGEKDAVDADGNPVYQGIDTSFLVATLTAAIQEQQAMIEELKAKVAALEAK